MRLGLTILLAASASLWLDAAAAAQTPSATMSMTADRTQVAVGETFRLQIRVDVTNGGTDGLQVPDLSAFRIVGQRTSTPMQFRFGFGTQQRVVQASAVHDYTLMPLREGRIEIGPAKLQLGGRTYASNPITIDATAGQVPGGADPGGVQIPGAPPAGPLDGASFDPEAFVRTVVSDPRPFVGEQLTVTVYLYTRAPLRSQPVVSREPSADGFWVHDLLSPTRTYEPHPQVVNGVPFQVYVLRRFAAFPLREGNSAIGAMSVSWDTGSILSLFGTGNQQTLRRDGVAVPVEIQPLPAAGRPAGSIAVGSYELEARVDRAQVATGDAVTLTATLTGTGNVRDVTLDVPRIDDLRTLSPQIRDDVTAPSDLVRGTRTWEWLIVPEREGSYTLPALSIGTFDPATERYGSARAQPITIVAAGNALGPPSPDLDDAGNATDDADALPDVQPQLGPVRTSTELLRTTEPVSRASWYPWALGAPPLAFVLLWLAALVGRRARERRAQNAPARAVRGAKKRLAHANTLATQGDAAGFYGEIRRVLQMVLEVRLGEQVGGFTHPELRGRLAERGMDEDLARRVVDELEGSEFARFSAAGASSEEIASCTERVGALLTRLDRFTPAEPAS